MLDGKSFTIFALISVLVQAPACSKDAKDASTEGSKSLSSTAPTPSTSSEKTRKPRRPAEREGRDTLWTTESKDVYRRAMILGSAKYYSGLFEEALAHYLVAMDARPKHMSPALGALRCLGIRGHAEQKANITRTIRKKIDHLSANPSTQGAGYLLGARLAIALGQTGEALDQARLAVQRLPKLGVAWRVLGEAAMTSEEWQQAVNALDEAARLGLQAAPGTWERLADTLDELGDLERAHEAAKKAVELTGNDPHARRKRLNLMAVIQKHQGQYKDALATIGKAEAYGASDPSLIHNKASIIEASGNIKEAIALYREALEITQSPMTAWRLGHALMKLEEFADAFDAFKSAAANMDRWSWPSSTRWMPPFELGKLHFRARLHERSIHWFEIALREAQDFESSKKIRSWLAFVSGQSLDKKP
jgi:tetratricopeptide (TPR) repeat protein